MHERMDEHNCSVLFLVSRVRAQLIRFIGLNSRYYFARKPQTRAFDSLSVSLSTWKGEANLL